MAFKTCPDCHNISYSAADKGIWFCPCCGKELSLFRAGERPCRLRMLPTRRKMPQEAELLGVAAVGGEVSPAILARACSSTPTPRGASSGALPTAPRTTLCSTPQSASSSGSSLRLLGFDADSARR